MDVQNSVTPVILMFFFLCRALQIFSWQSCPGQLTWKIRVVLKFITDVHVLSGKLSIMLVSGVHVIMYRNNKFSSHGQKILFRSFQRPCYVLLLILFVHSYENNENISLLLLNNADFEKDEYKTYFLHEIQDRLFVVNSIKRLKRNKSLKGNKKFSKSMNVLCHNTSLSFLKFMGVGRNGQTGSHALSHVI
jgi:hypothetical protein